MDLEYPPIKRPAWRPVDDLESRALWDRFTSLYRFRASGGRPIPVIDEPTPSVTFDLSSPDGGIADGLIERLQSETLACFATEFSEVVELYVLDWQHQTFALKASFELQDDSPKDEINGYPTVYPNGDYYAYLTPDLRNGTFGHPWEHSLCVIGERLVRTLGASLGDWLPVLRFSGDPGSTPASHRA
jgi:hypothetical protein